MVEELVGKNDRDVHKVKEEIEYILKDDLEVIENGKNIIVLEVTYLDPQTQERVFQSNI